MRLLLVRHAATPVTRAGAFPRDEPLDAGGRSAAAGLRALLPPAPGDAVCSPARRCRETAAAAGLQPRTDPRLAECDFGAWAGRTLAEIDADDPAATRAWMLDPAARPHGGESLEQLLERAGGWLAAVAAAPVAAGPVAAGPVADRADPADPVTVAVTHAGVIRAAVVHALGAPASALWRLRIEPLSLTELAARDGGWELHRLNWRPHP